MKKLAVYMEIKGEQVYAGTIFGDSFRDACFSYATDYLNSGNRAISVSLPLSDGSFPPDQTANFFEGLLPEGFSRRAVADWARSDENDYLTILSTLGRESLGALKIVSDEDGSDDAEYERLTIEKLKELAAEGATRSAQILMQTHLSLTGASGKAGLYFDEKNGDWYLPKGNAPSTHIVKQSHVRLQQIVMNEQICMLTAKKLGLAVPESFIINTGNGLDSEVLYAIRRYDRCPAEDQYINGLPVPRRLHQEDFSQALGIAAADKYEKSPHGYMRRMFETIRKYCTDPIAEQNQLWRSICFHFLIGNTDGHIKNFSLLYSDDLKKITLSPSYDIVSTRVYKMTEEMSFYIGDELRITRMNRGTFGAAASQAGLTERMAMRIFDELADHFETAMEEAADQLEDLGFRDANDLGRRILESGGYRQLG